MRPTYANHSAYVFLLRHSVSFEHHTVTASRAITAPNWTNMLLGLVLPNQFRCQRTIAALSSIALGLGNTWLAPVCIRVDVAPGAASNRKQWNEGYGGAERDRTVDPLLAKQVLSQLSYSPKVREQRLRWWAWVDSNYRPHPYQGCALTN